MISVSENCFHDVEMAKVRDSKAFKSWIYQADHYPVSVTDCSLELRDTKTRQIIGTISVRLETNTSTLSDPMGSRKSVLTLQSMVQKPHLDKSGRLEERRSIQIATTTHIIARETSPGGLEELKRAGFKLGKLLENLRPFMDMMDEASKVQSSTRLIDPFLAQIYSSQIHPYAQTAWKVISSLYVVSSLEIYPLSFF